MNRKKIISVILTLILLLVCVSACQAANPSRTGGKESDIERKSISRIRKQLRQKILPDR